jgi:hypothetical protein
MGIGRPKGSRNKGPDKLVTAREACSIVGLEPFVELAKLAQTAEDQNLRVRCLKELASFLAPKLQSIAHSGEMQEPVQVILNMGKGQ